jgi:uncharacterized protein YpmB
MNPKLISVIAIGIMLAIFTAYMIFLAYTWQQVQRDRTSALAKVDQYLDRLPKRSTDAPITSTE